MRLLAITIMSMLAVPAFGSEDKPIHVKLDLHCPNTNILVGQPILIHWSAENLSPSQPPWVSFPSHAIDADECISVFDSNGQRVNNAFERAYREGLDQRRKEIEQGKGYRKGVRDWIISGARGPRSVVPMQMLRPNVVVTGVWDIATLYPIESTGTYSLRIAAKGMLFSGTTNLVFSIKDQEGTKHP